MFFRLNILICIIILCCNLGYAQLITHQPDSIHVEGKASEFEFVAYTHVTNSSNNNVTIRWVRTKNDKPDVWWTAICDKNVCHLNEVDSAQVDLLAGDSTNLDLHFYPFNRADFALVKIEVFDITKPNERLHFTFTGRALADTIPDTTQPPPPTIKRDVKMYPNPLIAPQRLLYFDVPLDFGPASLVISTTDGRLMAQTRLDKPGKTTFDCSHFRDGYYVVLLLADSGLEYHNKLFIKSTTQ